MATLDSDPSVGRQPDPNPDEPVNPLRHYAGVLRRRARFSVIALLIGLVLGFVASFFIKDAPITTRYYKAVNTLAMTSEAGGSNDNGYPLSRAAQLIQDNKLWATVAKKVGWDPVVTGHHLAAQVRPEAAAIDVIAIATNPKIAEELANTAAATLAKMADESSLEAYNKQLKSLTDQQAVLTARVETLRGDPSQAAQLVIVQNQLNGVQTQLAGLGGAPSRLGLATQMEAHATEINKTGYKQRLDNAINLPGQLQQNTNAVTPTDQTFNETDLSRSTVPGRFEQILIGGLIGLIIGIIISFVIEAWDDKVRSRERVELLCDLPVLAEIPHLDTEAAATHEIAMVDKPKSPIAERYRTTCTSTLFALGESATERPGVGNSSRSHTPVILVTSPNPGEGKTTTSANLCAALADTGRRVLAVDADFRRPALAKFLAPIANLDDPDRPSATRVDNVAFLAAPHEHGAVGDTVFELRKMIAAHQDNFDIVVVDTPPMLTTNDAVDLLAAADATLLVLRAGRTRTNSAQRAATVLSRLRADVLGVVLNGCDRKEMENYYGYGYGYGDGYYYYGGAGGGDGKSDEKKRRGKKSSLPGPTDRTPKGHATDDIPVSQI